MSYEDCIDVVKDWVLAQVYATEAWVLGKDYQSGADMPEWTMPLSVSGILNPDSTCTYLKTGTHNGQPYYRRLDGAYFIWWDGERQWRITTELGVVAQPEWRRVGDDVTGIYSAILPTTGTATVSEGLTYLKTGFVDRGDPGAQDWTKLDFAVDGGWHDLDLSAIVPAGAKSVLFVTLVQHTLVNKLFMLRSKGNANIFNISSINTVVANVNYYQDWVCPCDENRVIQYRATPPAWAFMKLTVKGWWF